MAKEFINRMDDIAREQYGNDPGGIQAWQKNGKLIIGAFELSPVGMTSNRATSIDEWIAIGNYLRRLNRSIVWLIADWMIIGEREHKRTYEDAALLCGRSVKTLYNWAYTARNIDISRRREILTFTHHAMVAGFSEEWQSHLLGIAEDERLSSREFQARIESELAKATSAPPPPPPKVIDSRLVKTVIFAQKVQQNAQKIARKAQGEDRAQLRQFARDQMEWWRKFDESLDL